VPTPTGAQLLPACGIAWGIKLDRKPNLVVTTVGDAATRQGDFFEAICFAKEKQLPVLFVVEDNGYGISSPTRQINPLAIDVLQPNDWRELDGADVPAVYEAGQEAIAHLRGGKGPVFFWVRMERLSSHTSSDDHKLYRSAEEIENLAAGDPLTKWKDGLIADGVLTAEAYSKLDQEIKERVRQEFIDAELEQDPSPDELELQVTGELPQLDDEVLPAGRYRIGDVVNQTLRAGLTKDSRRILFGEDIEKTIADVRRIGVHNAHPLNPVCVRKLAQQMSECVLLA
jgi:2-oxoisovalerate dehydrogenase E1 component